MLFNHSGQTTHSTHTWHAPGLNTIKQTGPLLLMSMNRHTLDTDKYTTVVTILRLSQ